MKEDTPMDLFFPLVAIALIVGAGVLFRVGYTKRSRPAQAAAFVAVAIALAFGGAWMFGIV